jgi:hypothetical protein
MRNLLALLLGLSAGTLSGASPLPPLVLPEGVGVNIHFTRGHEADLDLIAAGGFKFIRMDFSWGGTEHKPGEYDWAAYDALTANLAQRHLRPIYIFDYSNGLYEEALVSADPTNGKPQRDTAAPRKPESVAAFARWAAAAAKHFQGRGVVWEIWNEPNIGFWKPKPDVKAYTALALATCHAVHEADPQATIIAPASSEFPWAFLEQFLASGVLEHLSAVSVHPYRNYERGPETAAGDFLKLRGLIERYAPADRRNIPIISGEWGYATQTKGVSLETQAAFVARQQLANLWQGVPISIWYDWKNDGPDPADAEHNFGVVTSDLKPKPSYLAIQTLTRELAGYRIARRLETASADDFVLLFVNDSGAQKLAAWTTGKPYPLALTLDLVTAENVAVVNGQGQPVEVKVESGNLRLDLQPAPQYVTLRQPNRGLSAAAAWSVSGWVPTLIEAGRTGGVKIPIVVTNPFTQAVQVRLEMKLSSIYDGKLLCLDPQQNSAQTFNFTSRLRKTDGFPVTITAEFQEQKAVGVWQLIGRSSEVRQFLVANPLSLQLAPAEDGMRVQIQNPSGGAFTGAMSVSGTKLPVKLAQGETETTLTASAQATAVQLLDADGVAVSDLVRAKFRALEVGSLKAMLDGDAKVPATSSASETAAPGGTGSPFARALKLDYSFDVGWRFVRCAPAGSQPVQFADQPRALGLWVYGDGSGNRLRTRVTDAAGQTFQPDGPVLDWTGWRWVTFDLTDLRHAGHWGGANDGVVHGALHLDTLLLVDGSRHQTKGTVYLAGPVLSY